MSREKTINVFAIDISGSTSGNREYYQNVERILNQMYKSGDIIIEWNGNAKKITRSEIQNRINSRNGNGWTAPCSIIKYLSHFSIKNVNHFVLITDGNVTVGEIDKCDNEIKNNSMTFDRFDGFIIGQKTAANLSVTCPFTRCCSHEVTQIEPGKKPETISKVSDDDFKIIEKIKTIDDLDEFMNLYPTMERVFAARLLGTIGDQELRKEVVKMQQRITLSIAEKDSESEETCLFVKFIEKGDMQYALNTAQKFLHKQNTEYERNINALIRMCDGGLRQTFNSTEIKSFRAKIAEQAETVEVIEIDDVPTDVKTTFECPVSYENETDPVILIAKPDQPILNLIDNKFSTNNVINCPLDIFLCKEPLEEMKKCIDHPLSLKTMREAENCNQQITKSPLTRKQLIGCLPLGASEDHVNAANWTLYQLVSGGKRLGNPDMWFAVIWMMIERNMIPYLTEILPFVREQMIFRLKTHRVAASLSDLSSFCQKKMPLVAACWFCLTSPFFITDETRNQNMLRYHQLHCHILKEMVDLVGYKYPVGFDRVITRSIAFASLLKFKRDHRKTFDTMIRCLYQNSFCIEIPENADGDDLKQKSLETNKFFIPIDGPATEKSREEVLKVLPKACRKLELNELVWISKFVDINKSATKNVFPMTEDAPQLPEFEVNWSHVDEKYKVFENVEICPETMRPYKIINGVKWKDIYKSTFGANSLVLVGCDAAFCEFINDYGWFPSVNEYILFYSRRIQIKTLPSTIDKIIKYRIHSFEKAIKLAGNINQFEVADRFNATCTVEEKKNYHYYFSDN